MNRTDRLLAIVLELQGKRQQRASDLAATFETSTRTIYRDIQALSEAGVPILSIPGKGYSLAEGYFLPPICFTSEEATMLLMGARVMAHSFDAAYGQCATDAARKIAGLLPESLQTSVQQRQKQIFFGQNNCGTRQERSLLPPLRRAIFNSHQVTFDYRARFGSGVRSRCVDPYELVHYDGTWYLHGDCHLRQAPRIFRLSRMANLQVLEQTFTPKLNREGLGCCGTASDRDQIVKLWFAPNVIPWVNEDAFFFIVSRESVDDGLIVTLAVRHYEEIVAWVLGWGRHVKVLEPPEFRDRLRDELQHMTDNFAEKESSSHWLLT